jgi:putative CocE/NonD family hydrolase
VDVVVEKNVAAPMRDGTLLRADVYRPAEQGRYPVLVQRTPYNKEMWPLTAATLDPVRAAAAGFVVVIQDVRSRWASEGGGFSPYRDESADGYDTVGWASTLPYGNGRVGAYGVSYAGATTWHAAVEAPSALGAISPTTAPNDFFTDHIWRGGALLLGTIAMWSLQAIGLSAIVRAHAGKPEFFPSLVRMVDDIDAFDRWTRHRPLRAFPPARPEDQELLPFFFEMIRCSGRDEYTHARSVSDRHYRVRAPALILAGWHDLLLAADLQHYRAMREQAATEAAREGTRLVIGPWSHRMFLNVVGELDFGLRASGVFLDLREDLTAMQLRWFGHWLSDEATTRGPDGPRVRVFVQGVNRWRDADDWPLAGVTDRRLHLRSAGGLTFEPPDDDEPPDAYVFDPEQPCPTRGGALLMPRHYAAGPVEQGPLLHRRDVLCFTSAARPRARSERARPPLCCTRPQPLPTPTGSSSSAVSTQAAAPSTSAMACCGRATADRRASAGQSSRERWSGMRSICGRRRSFSPRVSSCACSLHRATFHAMTATRTPASLGSRQLDRSPPSSRSSTTESTPRTSCYPSAEFSSARQPEANG